MKLALKKIYEEGLTAEEAIMNLTTISEMDVDEKTAVGILKDKKITTREEDFSYKEIEWLYPEDPIDFVEHIKPSYRTLLKYLEEICKDPKTDWKDISFKEGIKSVMLIALEATFKLKEFFHLFNKEIEFQKSEEFNKLREFYIKNILPHFPEGLEGDYDWEKGWVQDEEVRGLDLDKSGINNLESIFRDQHYELFQLRDENDKPLISFDLTKNIKLFFGYDEAFLKKEDFSLKIRDFNDKDMQVVACQILNILKSELLKFYQMKFNLKKNKLAASISKAVIALMLASNYKNLSLYKKEKKSCISYFRDFQLFLREGYNTDEYVESFEYKGKKPFLIDLLHKISFSFFNRISGVKEEITGYIHKLMNYQKEDETLWNEILRRDDNLKQTLKKYPNGPLKKIIEVLEEDIVGFDPILQGNIPTKLYDIDNKIDVLHLPSPTRQENLLKAVVLEEFKGFLSVLEGKHIIFNFQDKNSLIDHARVEALENIENRAEFKSKIDIVSIDKNSDFYYQNKIFEKESSFLNFEKEFKKRILEEKYFSFPKEILIENIVKDIDQIHKILFFSKKDLSRQERMDFIEIFYHFLILKIIIKINPKSISFSSKDGLDVSSCQNGSFYAFMKMLKGEKIDKELLFWLLYSSPLLIRERGVDSEAVDRICSFLAFLDSKKDKIKNIFIDFSL
ncbi:MAG: hypothetical protein AMS24_03820 [Chlamydiae bacterium SM23_39]|nr:MAG: hypothetical protein AMS24_03820 [Chlamydiae bacterium SM23_39]